MFVRSFNVARRFVTTFFGTIVIGSVAVPTAALAESPVAAERASALSLVDRAIAPNVAEREPVGAGAEFDASVGAVYAWVQVKNLGEATTISMVWKKNGKTRLTVELPVGRSYGWKTWSKKGIGAKDAGAWTVEVLDGDGALVETLAFNVKAPSDVSAK